MKLQFFENPIVLLLILLLGFNHPAHPQKKELKEADYFYKIFSGNIENQPIIVEVYKTEEGIEGQYHHPEKSHSVFLKKSEKDTSDNGNWYFKETTKNSDSYWEGSYSGDSFKGSIKRQGNTATYFELKEEQPEGMTGLSYQHFDKKIPPQAEENEDSSYQILYIFPVVSGIADNNWINKQIKKLLNFDEGLSFEHNLANESEEAEEAFMETLEELEDPYEVIWEKNSFTTIAYNRNGFLILKKTETNYMGGAHGYTGISYRVLDTKNQYTTKLSHLLKIDQSELQHLLEKEFRKKYDLSEDQELNKILFGNEIPLTKNFYFDDNGLYFVYNPYDIAPYSIGNIELFVPFKKLKNNLTSQFRKRIHLKTETRSDSGKII